MNPSPISSVVMGWHGLPAYAARLIRGVEGNFPVVATRPAVPIQGMDEILPGRIHWIEENYSGGWRGLGLSVPQIYFQPSWNTLSFNLLGDEVRRAGGSVVVMFDNPWRGNLRQCAGALRFRTQWKKHFKAAWVAGASGYKLARFWGFESDRIFQCLYGADPDLFLTDKALPLDERPRDFVFVGRLVEQKGVRDLMKAWGLFLSRHPDWRLHIYGTGPLESFVRLHPVIFHGFQQPEIISIAMQSARFLVLPSHDEHWGLVVCEAAQAGCGLILSGAVGSHADLLTVKNGRLFETGHTDSLVEALVWASERNTLELKEIEISSRAVGREFTPARFANCFKRIVAQVSK